jgi:multidrug efflux pump
MSAAEGNRRSAEDVVGVIQYEFVDWRERKPASEILMICAAN